MKTQKLDHSKVYNCHRLKTVFGAVMPRHKVDAQGYQDHYAVCPDGSVWRYRNPSDYYMKASGAAMLVCVSMARPGTSGAWDVECGMLQDDATAGKAFASVGYSREAFARL